MFLSTCLVLSFLLPFVLIKETRKRWFDNDVLSGQVKKKFVDFWEIFCHHHQHLLRKTDGCNARSGPWDKWGRSSRLLDKGGREGAPPPQFFRPFGPQFGLKLRGGGGVPWIRHWVGRVITNFCPQNLPQQRTGLGWIKQRVFSCQITCNYIEMPCKMIRYPDDLGNRNSIVIVLIEMKSIYRLFSLWRPCGYSSWSLQVHRGDPYNLNIVKTCSCPSSAMLGWWGAFFYGTRSFLKNIQFDIIHSGQGKSIFGLITLPLVINCALLESAKKLKSSKCWWGQCVLAMRAIFT